MALKEFLKEAMPEGWLMKLFLLAISPLGAVLSAWGSGLLLPFLKGIDPLLLLRTIGAISGLLIALLAYIGWLLYKLKIKNDELNDEDRFVKKLSDETINLLKTIYDTEEWLAQKNFESIKEIPRTDIINVDWFAIKLKMSVQKIKYHLDQLDIAKLIRLMPDGFIYEITPKGRAFLHKNELLS